ncbi:mannosyltransferase [Cryobacterium roopkundense]|uniref:Glycosyltransferase involved in cell wall biosynthesis n=1 Tax=Cryobacterium roopkundense TaxID=1001240 RepID=A0A099JHP7_9MICO|nr:glycosyltransferase family 1 protein [Cryobacterium roopkundense]KGJ77092.1 mannosyltransferase [Cryobacterium roopkundense]MBB5642171.1 glycosyltransferase involved in cell wall biosynthesis [Cryobacterium roopkundense]
MITLRVVVDQMVAPVPGGIGRYTEELTRALIATAPAGCEVEGIVSSSPAEQYEKIEAALPGLASLSKTALARREVAAAWSLGVTASSGTGMIHAPSLLAPMRRHDRLADGTQIAVTIHDVLAWTHPESLTTATVGWTKAMVKRARKHADAVVVPSHAVAAQLADIVDFGDRVRVIGGAVGRGLVLPSDSLVSGRVAALGLPQDYIATTGSLDPRKGVTSLITALGLPGAPDLPLIVIGPDSWGELDIAAVADEAGLAPGRVRAMSGLSDEDLAIVIARAALFVYPSREEGFALPIIEAFHLGTPVVHSDAPALVEAAGDAGLVVPLADAVGYSERLAAAMTKVLTDTELEQRLRIFGSDRAKAFSWRDSAERVWQLHADL